jgi:hypothetical protein
MKTEEALTILRRFESDLRARRAPAGAVRRSGAQRQPARKS